LCSCTSEAGWGLVRKAVNRVERALLVLEFREWFPGVHLNGNSVMSEDIRSHFAENVIGRKEAEQARYKVPLENADIWSI
jgi:hypothetical protein